MKSKISNRLDGKKGASGTLAHNGDQADTVDCGKMLTNLVRRYQTQKQAVSVNFRRILPHLNSADRFAHLIHPYPAKLLVHIPFFFLANDLLSKPGDTVLDPFCGSGTVLAEAQLAGRCAYGADANALARLIASVKTAPFDGDAAFRELSRILKRTHSTPRDPRPDVVNIDHWFYPRTITKLQCLYESIQDVSHPLIRRFFLICFSACIRKVSLADPRLSVPVKLKFGQYPKGHPLRTKTDAHLRNLRRVDVLTVFAGITRSNIVRMNRLRLSSPRQSYVEVLCSDARCLNHEYSANGLHGKPLTNESIQLIITSPPYPGAQKYIRACSLSLGWLGLCSADNLRAYKSRIIGREEFSRSECQKIVPTNVFKADKLLKAVRRTNPIRATIAATYLNDMRSALREMHRVLKPDGYIVLVAANNRIAGKKFRTVDYLKTIAQECGFFLTACFVDSIRSRGLMTKRNKTASVITRESVLIFSKGKLPEWAR